MGSTISLTSSDGFQLSAYRAEPEGAVHGGVVVVQEIFGVNSHIRSVADRYAAAGYLAIAPAIFDRDRPGIELGYNEEDIAIGRDIARGKLDFQKVLADVDAAGKAAAEAGKVGVVGYCYGGLVTAAAAINLSDTFTAASSYYGGGTVELIDRTPAIPMIMHYGERDHAIPLDDVAKIAAAWPKVTVNIYDAEHGFNCDHRASFSAVPAAIAQARTYRFFDDHLSS
ncbi:MAG TPA: dienelactone hydrolase family protein [Ilumatobacteraceae bacterium]|jgi:carboxymethylenebutenolidase|nr:dienelactone hydrolase family protein [Ilumatobacteraceae bacterium]